MTLDTQAPERRYKVLLGIPCQDQVSSDFSYDLARLVGFTVATMADVEIHLQMWKSTLLPSSRQGLAMEALNRGCTHICMIDADMRFEKDTLVKLLAHEVPIVAVNYPTRRFPIKPTAQYLVDGVRKYLYTEPDSTGLVEVLHAGFGFVVISTEVLRGMPLPWFHLHYNERDYTFAGEDVWFCNTAREHGFKIFVDQDVSRDVAHVGTWEFQHHQALVIRDQFPAGAAAEESE